MKRASNVPDHAHFSQHHFSRPNVVFFFSRCKFQQPTQYFKLKHVHRSLFLCKFFLPPVMKRTFSKSAKCNGQFGSYASSKFGIGKPYMLCYLSGTVTLLYGSCYECHAFKPLPFTELLNKQNCQH